MSISEDVGLAASLIRQGRLVAFPTETVYGLGADALNPTAVESIFRAKGRPATSPLIVHVDSIEMARSLVLEWPDAAEILARRFWPGPLTLVLTKRTQIPDVVTAGLPTVGLRLPAHPVALALIRAAGVPIAAPSANRFTELSPTTAEHVRRSLGDQVDLILDGGSTDVGIESTVLSLAGGRPLLLRPGMIGLRAIEEALGSSIGSSPELATGEAHPAPGMHARHYSPRTPLYLVPEGVLPAQGRGAYLWLKQPADAAKTVRMPADAASYGAVLYDSLHQLDAEGWDWIAVEKPPAREEWSAILDRLRRAAATPAGQ